MSRYDTLKKKQEESISHEGLAILVGCDANQQSLTQMFSPILQIGNAFEGL